MKRYTPKKKVHCNLKMDAWVNTRWSIEDKKKVKLQWYYCPKCGHIEKEKI